MRKKQFRVVPGGKTSRRNNKLWRRLFAGGMVVLTAFLIWNSMGYLSLFLATEDVALNGKHTLGVPVQCLVVRNEHVVMAPADGEYIPLEEDGKKVPVGKPFAQIKGTGGSYNLEAPVSGIVRHGHDGLWEQLHLDMSMEQLDVDLVAAGQQWESVDEATDNQVVAVIIDNNLGFQLITSTDFHVPQATQTLKINSENGSVDRVSITPKDVHMVDGKFRVLWDVPRLPDAWGLKRSFEAKLVTGRYKMAYVPAQAVTSKDDEVGVYVKYRGKPVFNPVDVVDMGKDQVGVQGLSNGDLVLSLSRWLNFLKWWW